MLEQQWLTIYRETVHPLYGYLARRTGGNREMTEDIVQESYLRALDRWNFKAVPECPLAWLKRVARNILIDALRRKKWDAISVAEDSPGEPTRTAEDPVASLELFRAVSSLGKKKARVIEAFYYDGLNVKEIAAEMGLSERAVEGLLRRARQSLKAVLPDPQRTGGSHE